MNNRSEQLAFAFIPRHNDIAPSYYYINIIITQIH